jgi:hypothetical protein
MKSCEAICHFLHVAGYIALLAGAVLEILAFYLAR